MSHAESNVMKNKTKIVRVGSGELVRARRARLTRAIVGQFTRWNVGTLVWARKQEDGNYFITRVHHRVNKHVRCLNELAGAPRDLLRFEARPNSKITNSGA